jgi:hypothetical protein
MGQDQFLVLASDEPGRREAEAARPALVQTWVVRTPLFLAGVVLPVAGFLVVNVAHPTLRLAEWPDYAALLLLYPALVALCPFLLYAMVSMCFVVFWRGRCDTNNFVRFGIFSGVLIAAEYCVLLLVASSDGLKPLGYVAIFLATAFVVLVPMGILWLDTRLVRKCGVANISFTLALVIGALGLLTGGRAFFWVVFPCLLCSAPWAIAAYMFVSIRLIWASQPPRFRFSLAQLLAVTTWFAAHCAAWRCAVLLMLHQCSRQA